MNRLTERIDASSLPDLNQQSGSALNALDAAEASGLKYGSLSPGVKEYIVEARDASNYGYSVTFITVAVLATIAGGLVAWLVRKPSEDAS